MKYRIVINCGPDQEVIVYTATEDDTLACQEFYEHMRAAGFLDELRLPPTVVDRKSVDYYLDEGVLVIANGRARLIHQVGGSWQPVNLDPV
jgi:hypothetical protein